MKLRPITTGAYFVGICLAVLCYLGSVRSTAVWTYLLPAVVISVVATAAPRKPTSYAALISGLICGMTWAVVVNTLSGEYLGPVARSTSACIIGTTLIVFGLRRREPNTGLIGELIIIAGALFYGAANEVWKLALISMVFHLVGYFGTSQANQKRQPRELSWRSLLILFLLPVVSTAVVFTASWNIPETLNFNNPRKSAVLGNVEISPPWISTENKTAAVIGVPTTTDAPNITEPNLVVKPDSNKVKKIQVDKSIVLKIIWIIL